MDTLWKYWIWKQKSMPDSKKKVQSMYLPGLRIRIPYIWFQTGTVYNEYGFATLADTLTGLFFTVRHGFFSGI
jgi:hypothetical protein